MQSFLKGAIWGLLLGGGGLVVASLVTEQPVPPQTATPAPVVVPEPVAEAEVAPNPPAPVAEPDTTPAPAPPASPPAMPQARLVPPAVPQAAPAPDVPAPAPELALDALIDELLDTPDAPVAVLPEPEPEPEPAAPAVRINRPTTDTPEPDASAPDLADLTPLVRFAADVDYAADLPKLAVVLMDDPQLADAPALLRDLPFLPSVVLNAGAGDVTARMQAYRAAGIEVGLQADLPAGAQPSDVETTLSAAFDLVPQAIAIFSDGTGPEASSTAIAGQIMQRIVTDGRGFVTIQRGLGGAVRIAEQAGVPVASIERALDDGADTQPAVERGLQQAALRARQNGQAVLLGRVTPETVDAIRAWANRSDPSQLALAPVSAILLDQLADDLPPP